MAWIFLAGAILFEIAATTSMKLSAGLTKAGWTVGLVAAYLVSFALLSQALKTFEVGTAYAIWAGVGTALIAAIGMAFFDETISATKIAGIALVVVGVVVLNLSGAH
ncbi:multidrug efflux SMR transporter [Micromonospora sp. NPDC049679]|uniref:DMT family transporter n=1 Tax=Micromonospora sp. NPDC049679 TaxID=3155920 RepID=UPI0033DFDC49